MADETKRDWVEEAYQAFVKNAEGLDPTDPVKAIEAYFEKNATDELKARCKAEGKDAKGCWRFIEAVARKALKGQSGHLDPGAVYAMAMHWYEDVPKDWDAKPEKSEKPTKRETKIEKLERKISQGQVSPARKKELKAELAKAKPKAKKKAKPRDRQGFFFGELGMGGGE